MRALRPRHFPRSCLFTLALVGASAIAASAPAQSDDERIAAAEKLFQEGITALEAGDWDKACPKFTASMDLDRSVGTMLNVAKCHEHEGRLTAALADYREALDLNEKVTDTERRERVRAYTQDKLEQLAPRVPRVRIQVSPEVDGLRVTRDGQDVPVASLSSPLRMDPGEHEVVVSAPGHVEERRTIKLTEGQEQDLSIVLRPAGDAPAAGAPGAIPSDPSEPYSPPPEQTAHNPLVPIGWGVAGVGVVGLGVGAVTGIMAIGQKSTVEDLCPEPANCTDEGVSEAETGSTLATVSTIGFIAGGVFTAAGLFLVFGTGGEGEATGLAPSIGPSHAGLTLRGAL